MASFPRFMIAATHSGAGKTSWTLGILAALVRRGLRVQPFKAGPDYIDPGLHSLVAGRPSRNLDTRLVSESRLRALFRSNAAEADLSLVEGVMGYYDGSGPHDDSGSGASLARLLGLPVFLIIDISGTSSSAAAVALGFVKYRRNSRIAGFLLNRAGSERHYHLTKGPIEEATGLPVLGWLPADSSMALPGRHLGLVAGNENSGFDRVVGRLAAVVERCVDLDSMLAIAHAVPDPKAGSRESFLRSRRSAGNAASRGTGAPIRIAVARDEAFSFYYQDNFDILGRLGAELCFFSPLRDEALPEDCRGLYLGGGYPELYAATLESNIAMRAAIRNFTDSGAPVFAECGGYMYLMDAIVGTDGVAHPMAGVLRGKAIMGKKQAALGYYDAILRRDCPLGKTGDRLSGHCFHWSRIEADSGSSTDGVSGITIAVPALLLSKPDGTAFTDGLARDSVFASYLHIHFAGNPEPARNFLRASAARRTDHE